VDADQPLAAAHEVEEALLRPRLARLVGAVQERLPEGRVVHDDRVEGVELRLLEDREVVHGGDRESPGLAPHDLERQGGVRDGGVDEALALVDDQHAARALRLSRRAGRRGLFDARRFLGRRLFEFGGRLRAQREREGAYGKGKGVFHDGVSFWAEPGWQADQDFRTRNLNPHRNRNLCQGADYDYEQDYD